MKKFFSKLGIFFVMVLATLSLSSCIWNMNSDELSVKYDESGNVKYVSLERLSISDVYRISAEFSDSKSLVYMTVIYEGKETGNARIIYSSRHSENVHDVRHGYRDEIILLNDKLKEHFGDNSYNVVPSSWAGK